MEQLFKDVKWPAEYTELTRIEELLHCRICYEYIDTSVITPCSHNYCSICIRKFLHYKTQCPICFENIYEKDLHANRILDEFMSCYLTLREKLLTCIKGAQVKKRADSTPVKPRTPKPKTSQLSETRKQIGLTVLSPEKINSRKVGSDVEDLTKTPTKRVNAPSTSNNTPRINTMFRKNEEKGGNDYSNGKMVPCPVCNVDISDAKINRHLDDCLKRQTSMDTTINVKNSLQPMPKYVLKLMKDPELRKTLKKYGLSTAGGRKVLEKRMQRFSTLYNVERDKLVPKSIEEIARQCESEEIAEKNISKQNSTDNMLNIDRKTDLGVIEMAHRQYLEKHKEDYKKLIETINGRSSASRSLFGEGTSLTSHNATSQSIFNDSETNSSIFDLSQGFPVDSDSTDMSCPLQHYSRDDTMKFLVLNMSTDSQDSPLKLNTSTSTNQTAKRSSTESTVSTRYDKIVTSPTKTRRNSSSKSESPLRFSTESRASLRPENSSDRISSPLKIENGTESLSDKIVLSNPSASSTIFPLDSKDSTSLGEVEVKKPSAKDIFDASTEDNWSDPFPRDFTANRTKKLVKRSKFDPAEESSGSETDIEPSSVRSIGRRTKKQKHRNKIGNGDGSLRAEEPAVGCSSQDVDKENSGEFEATKTRRSTRKRTLVSSYAPISGKGSCGVTEKSKNGGKKVLDEQPVNVIIDVAQYDQRSKAAVTREDPDHDAVDDPPENLQQNRSLRKRRKL